MEDPHEWAKRAFDRADQRRESQFQAATESANVAVKGLLILNGGACLALLAFLANVVDKEKGTPEAKAMVDAIIYSLGYFACGAGAAVFTSGLAYLVNRAYAESLGVKKYRFEYPYVDDTQASKGWALWGNGLNVAAVALFFVSLGCFAAGVYFLAP